MALAPTIPRIATHLSVAWSVCRLSPLNLSHSCPCLNRLKYFNAVRQVHLWRPMIICVRRGRWPSKER